MNQARQAAARDIAFQVSPSHIQEAVRAGAEYLFELQQHDFHWCAELESAPMITAEYVYMCQALGLDLQIYGQGVAPWLLSRQKADGSYGLAINCPGDVSTTAEIYLALKMLGMSTEHPAMQKARAFVLAQGGLARVRIFSRIYFAMFGLFDWRDVPAMPPEIILLPPSFSINIYSLASWARCTVVPLFIMAHHKPVFALPNGQDAENTYLDELWVHGERTRVTYLPPWKQLWRQHGISWTSFFCVSDTLLKAYEKLHNKRLRKLALERCTQWILDRQEPSGDWGGIFPPMANNLLVLPLQGYAMDSEPMRLGLEAMERFAISDARGRRVQACISPVWDTVLSLVGLCDAGYDGADPRLARAADWVMDRQTTDLHGDWAVYRPGIPPGGWAFEYHNKWYPDVDDTVAVLLALLKQDPQRAADARVHVAVEWVLGMQNRDGGWGAFDAESDKLFLNDAPFTDMGALCDPSTADVTGRILEALGLLCAVQDLLPTGLHSRIEATVSAALEFLRRNQESFGAWFGRWGVNYLYGTCHVLCGLSQISWAPQPQAVARAVHWLKGVQNADGGWGETPQTYHDPGLAGQGPSTASQTAWGLMALLAHLPAQDPAITGGIAWLVRHQSAHSNKSSTWIEPEMTATGFPKHLYVRYDLYRHYFPMMALGRYARAAGLQSI